MAKYRLIAVDLDGTLKAEGQPVTPRVRAALQQAQACGVRVVMATGRMFRTAYPFTQELSLTDPVVCDQGATIWDLQKKHILVEKRIPLELVRELLAFVDGNLTLLACVDEEFYTARLTQDAVTFAGKYADEHLHTVADLVSCAASGLQKIVFVNDPDVSSTLFQSLQKRFGETLQVVQSYPRYVELTHRDASKGKAIAWLAEQWGIPREQVMAFGDQDNDRSMIEWAGLGVAMGNAIESVRAAAKLMAPSAEEDGVAEVIERLALS